jgi:hypothetical protein
MSLILRLASPQKQNGRNRKNERRRHHHSADFQERAEADRKSFAAQGGEPQDGGERAGHRQIGPEIDADQHRARTASVTSEAVFLARIPSAKKRGALLLCPVPANFLAHCRRTLFLLEGRK